ncbi:MAG: glycosyltransferase family 39 protein [Planctomycetales bacterium]
MTNRRKRNSASARGGPGGPSTSPQPRRRAAEVAPPDESRPESGPVPESLVAAWFRRPLWWVIGLAALVRADYLLQYLLSPLHGDYRVDQAYYREWAQRIAAGDWIGAEIFEQGPLYPYLLGTLYSIIGEQDGIVVALQLLGGVGTCVLAYQAAQKLFGRPAGFVAGLLAAVYGPLVFYEGMLMKSFLSPLLTMGALCCLLHAGERQSARGTIAAGFLIGLAGLVAENHLLLLVPAAAWLLIPLSLEKARGDGRRQAVPSSDPPPPPPWKGGKFAPIPAVRRLQHVALLALGCGLAVAPATIRNYAVAREFVLVTSGGGEVLYMAHGPYATGYYRPPDFVYATAGLEHEHFRAEARRRTGRDLTRAEADRYWFREAAASIAADPWRTVKLTAVKTAILFNDFEVPDSENYRVSRRFIPLLEWLPTFGWVAGLGFVGLFRACRDWRRCLLPLGFLAAHAAGVLLTYNFGRFRLGLMPIWMMFSAAGLVWLVSAWRASGQRRWAVAATALAVAVSVAAFAPPPGYSDTTYDWDTARLVGDLALASDPELAESAYREAVAAHRARMRRLKTDESPEGIERYRERVTSITGPMKATLLMQSAADVHFRLGYALASEGRYAESIEEFRVALRYDPELVVAHTQLAIASFRLAEGRPSPESAPLIREAVDHFREAVRLDPENLSIRHDFAALLHQLGRNAEAREQLESTATE